MNLYVLMRLRKLLPEQVEGDVVHVEMNLPVRGYRLLQRTLDLAIRFRRRTLEARRRLAVGQPFSGLIGLDEASQVDGALIIRWVPGDYLETCNRIKLACRVLEGSLLEEARKRCRGPGADEVSHILFMDGVESPPKPGIWFGGPLLAQGPPPVDHPPGDPEE